jgi:hypothetical protein
MFSVRSAISYDVGMPWEPAEAMRVDEEKCTKDRQHAEDGVEAVPRRGSSRLGDGQVRVTRTGRMTDSKSHGCYSLILCAHEGQMLSMAGSG